MKKQKPIYAWHFLNWDARGQVILRDGSPVPKAGETLKVEGPIIPCSHGLHASVNPLDACGFAPGSYITRVRLSGEIVAHGEDKHAASERTILYGFEASKVLRLFACWCIRNTKLADGRTVWDLLTDERSRKAVETAERFANGNATKAELDAAWDDARAAAWDDARAAARAAAWDDARDAARAAAWAAARDDARDAVRAAAWAAARAAARDDASKQLQKMLTDEAKNLGIYRADK